MENIPYNLEQSHDKPFVIITPQNDKNIESLKKWLSCNTEFLRKKISTVGGILFQGFNIQTPEDFQDIAKTIEPNLCTTHDFDDSARMWFTENIYEAFPSSFKSDPLPVDYHNEDSFMPYVPSTIMLCSIKPADFGGESMFSDCRKVFESFPLKFQQKIIKKTIRNSFTLHDSVFLVNSKIPKHNKKIEKLAQKYGATEIHRIDNFNTRFTFEIPTVIKHEASDNPVWFSRAHQACGLANIVDIWYSYKYRNNIFSTLKSYYLILKTIYFYYKNSLFSLWKSENDKVVYSYEDGSKISIFDQIRIRKAHWKNSTILPLKAGDLIILDNRLITHARMPYKGNRKLLSCIGNQKMVQQYNTGRDTK